jgi:hypothetical protein
LVQSLVASLRKTSLASIGVGLGTRPQRLIGCAHLSRDIARHLRWQLIGLSDVIVARLLQGVLIAHLAVRKGVATDGVQRIAVGQLGPAQGVELRWRRLQFEFGSDDLLHAKQYTRDSQTHPCACICEDVTAVLPPTSSCQ